MVTREMKIRRNRMNNKFKQLLQDSQSKLPTLI